MSKTTDTIRITIKRYSADGDYICSVFDHSTSPLSCITVGSEKTHEEAVLWKETTAKLQAINKNLWAPDNATRQALAITD